MHNSMFNILELHLGKKYDCSLSTSSDLDKDKSCKMSEQENLSFEHKFILDWLKENTQVR